MLNLKLCLPWRHPPPHSYVESEAGSMCAAPSAPKMQVGRVCPLPLIPPTGLGHVSIFRSGVYMKWKIACIQCEFVNVNLSAFRGQE